MIAVLLGQTEGLEKSHDFLSKEKSVSRTRSPQLGGLRVSFYSDKQIPNLWRYFSEAQDNLESSIEVNRLEDPLQVLGISECGMRIPDSHQIVGLKADISVYVDFNPKGPLKSSICLQDENDEVLAASISIPTHSEDLPDLLISELLSLMERNRSRRLLQDCSSDANCNIAVVGACPGVGLPA